MIGVRIHWFRRVVGSGCLALTVGFAGCGGSKESTQTATQGAPEAAQQKAGTVDPAKIERCGGFTSEMAATILGVPVSDIQATSELQYETLRICSFQSRSDSRKGISFSLGWETSAEEMTSAMARERENLGLAKRSIGAVTGSTDKSATLQEIPGLGDEAFYTQVNDTLVARVSNVRVQVMNAPNFEAYKQVARDVTNGLR